MYILSLIFMVKPIKLYTSVFIANSDWNGRKVTTLRSQVDRRAYMIMTDKKITSKLNIESP